MEQSLACRDGAVWSMHPVKNKFMRYPRERTCEWGKDGRGPHPVFGQAEAKMLAHDVLTMKGRNLSGPCLLPRRYTIRRRKKRHTKPHLFLAWCHNIDCRMQLNFKEPATSRNFHCIPPVRGLCIMSAPEEKDNKRPFAAWVSLLFWHKKFFLPLNDWYPHWKRDAMLVWKYGIGPMSNSM